MCVISADTCPNLAATPDGNWCGGGHGGLHDCCGGGPCGICTEALTNPSYYSPGCLQACPAVDAIDALCAQHDFCVFRTQNALGYRPMCNYLPPVISTIASWFTSSGVHGNPCGCDQALYNGVYIQSGGNTAGFAGNLLAWLSFSWVKCYTAQGSSAFGQNVPGRVDNPPQCVIGVSAGVTNVPVPPPPPPPKNCCCYGWCWKFWCCSRTCSC